jgi:RND family efflux transporter MFP subunit
VKQAEAGFKLARAQAKNQTWQKDIAMAEAQVEQTHAVLESAERLVQAKSWEAEITAAKTQLTQAKVMRDLARKRLADASIKASIRGIISTRHLDEGGMANPAAPLFEIVDMDVVYASVDVMESDLNKIHLEDVAWIHIGVLDAPVQGQLTKISPTVDEMTRTAQIEITVENSQHLLKPGMFAQVFIPTDLRFDTVLLPRSAVVEDETNGERHVFVVEEGRSRKKVVRYGLTEGKMVEIAQGLDAGVPVVISGQRNLRDGDFVQIVKVIKE